MFAIFALVWPQTVSLFADIWYVHPETGQEILT